MTCFSESNYEFTFDDRWQILKYDDHPYYRILSGRSFSGIDFAGIFENEHLYLIEVKNFYQYDNDGEISNVDKFVIEIKEKILDSIDLIRIINKYHQRKWTYRLLVKLVMRLPNLNRDWWFWTKMHQLLQSKHMSFVLLIESKLNNNFLKADILSSLAGEDYEIPNLIMLSIDKQDLDGISISKIYKSE